MNASIEIVYNEKVAIVTFYHPQSNSFPSKQLAKLTQIFDELSEKESITVILLKSEGKTFCAGASFDELLEIETIEKSQQFFSGFGRLLNSMKNCNKIIVTMVQGKAVGGGVGIICASDYVIASEQAAIKLSELNIGFGPYVIEPFVSKKMGKNNFYHVTLNPTKWFDAKWGLLHNIFNEIEGEEELLGKSLLKATEMSLYAKESLVELKKIYWKELKDYESNYTERAKISGQLILTEQVKEILENFKKK